MVTRLLGATALSALIVIVGPGLTPKALVAQGRPVLICAANNVQPLTETQISVTCSLIDNLGVPLADTPLTFYVNFEAGTDVAWENGRKTAIKSTDAQGNVTSLLDAGQKPGNLGVLVNYPGIYSSYTFVRVEPAPPPPSPVPALDELSQEGED